MCQQVYTHVDQVENQLKLFLACDDHTETLKSFYDVIFIVMS